MDEELMMEEEGLFGEELPEGAFARMRGMIPQDMANPVLDEPVQQDLSARPDFGPVDPQVQQDMKNMLMLRAAAREQASKEYMKRAMAATGADKSFYEMPFSDER